MDNGLTPDQRSRVDSFLDFLARMIAERHAGRHGHSQPASPVAKSRHTTGRANSSPTKKEDA